MIARGKRSEPIAVFLTTTGVDLPMASGALRLHDAQAAGYAADGATRVTGAPALLLTDGVGETLCAAAALATAWSDKSPVVAATRLDVKGSSATRNACAAVTRAAFRTDGDDLDAAMESAVAATRCGGPVQLTVAPTVTGERLIAAFQAALGQPDLSAHGDLDAATVHTALTTIRRWRRPVILAGRGAALAVAPAALHDLAQRLGAPVLLTAAATTLPPERLAALAGAFAADGALVPSGNMVYTRTLLRADGVLALGTGLSEVDGFGLHDLRIARHPLVRIDRVQPAHDPFPQKVLCGDVGRAVAALAGALSSPSISSGRTPKPDRAARVRAAGARWSQRVAAEADRLARAQPIEPLAAMHAIVAAAPSDTVFVSEGGSCGMWLWANLWLRPLVFPTQWGTLGVPIPYAAAIAHLRPGRPVWAIVGDGAFFYHAAELKTLAANGASAVFFVFVDESWSAIRLGQTLLYGGRHVGTDIARFDYAALAEACGCAVRSVERPAELTEVVAATAAHREPRPLVIAIRMRKDHIPFAGANFVLAELDGALRSLAPAAARSFVRSLVRGPLSLRDF